MEEQLQSHEDHSRMRWVGLIMGVTWSFAAVHSIWSLGRKPLGVLELIIVAVGVGWLIRTVNEWLPIACLIALALLLGSEKEGRRSIRETLWRFRSVAWIATAGAAFFWFWKKPSFASVVLSLPVLVLWFGNFLMHLFSGDRLALSHPQS